MDQIYMFYDTGLDRSLPGYPRYMMIGSEPLGEYNLMISGAQLEDDGEYQCQVGPSASDPPLLGTAQLNVLSEYMCIINI